MCDEENETAGITLVFFVNIYYGILESLCIKTEMLYRFIQQYAVNLGVCSSDSVIPREISFEDNFCSWAIESLSTFTLEHSL